MTVIALAAINATASNLVTVTVCGLGEDSTACKQVTYKQRSGGAMVAPISNGSSEDIYQAPAVSGRGLLGAINDYFVSKGLTAPVDQVAP